MSGDGGFFPHLHREAARLDERINEAHARIASTERSLRRGELLLFLMLALQVVTNETIRAVVTKLFQIAL